MNEFLVAKGQIAEGRTNAHGQGYDLVERPLFTPDEPMLLQANMVVALHPLASNDKAFALCCDDYLITAGKAERLHRTPQEVFVIEC